MSKFNADVTLANGNEYSLHDIRYSPTIALEILKNIDNVTINKEICIKQDLITTIILLWCQTLEYKNPEYKEISDCINDIINTPELYQHLKDKAVLPISIRLISNKDNFNSTDLLHNKFGEEIASYHIESVINKTLDKNILTPSDLEDINYCQNLFNIFGNIRVKDSFASYTFTTITNNIRFKNDAKLTLYFLKNLTQLEITFPQNSPHENKQDFIDMLIGFNENFKYSNILEFTEFKNLLKNIAQDPVQQNCLKKLGASEIDIAILSGNKELIQELANNNVENSPKLFSDWRCIELALNIYNDNTDGFIESEFYNFLIGVDLPVSVPNNPDYKLSLAFLNFNKNLGYTNLDLNNHNTAILISSAGHFAWNSKKLNTKFEHLKTVFDHTYFYGDGILNHNSEDIGSYLKNIFAKDIYKNDHKTIFVEINMHGYKDGTNIIELVDAFPNKPKNVEVIYLITSCHGRYGIKDLNKTMVSKKGNFIVVADYEENAMGKDLDIGKLCEIIKENPHSLNGYLDYFSKDFNGTKVFFSGKLKDGTILQNVSIHEANKINQDIIISNEPEIITQDELAIATIKHHDNTASNSELQENVEVSIANPTFNISENSNLYTISYENGNIIIHTIDNDHLTFVSDMLPPSINIMINGQNLNIDLAGVTNKLSISDINE